MTALTKNTPGSYGMGNYRDYSVVADDHIYEGGYLAFDADGYVGPLGATSRIFAGVADEECDNTSGAAAAKTVRVYRGENGRFSAEVTVSGVALTDVGKPVYATDDGAVTLDPGSATEGYVRVGKVGQYVTTNTAMVDFEVMTPQAEDEVVWFADFLGDAALANLATVDVGDATEGILANQHGGVYELLIDDTDEAEDAVLYAGDVLNFDLDMLKRFKCRAKVITPGAGVTVVFGMATAHHLTKDSVAGLAWFRCEAGLACKCETDDGTNDNDDKAAQTLVTDTYYDFEIDFSDVADVKFFIDGVQVATATTFDMSNLTTEMQPYFSCDKASGTTTAKLQIDYFEVRAKRAA